jgi:ABC-type transport system involved in multi-copper enzyme maturation permease subunit
MIASFTAEWRKLSRRPAVWVLGGILLAIPVLVYTFSWIQYTFPSASFRPDTGLTAAQLKTTLYPANFARQMVEGLAVVGSALMLVMGALIVGSEYGWATLKTVFTQRPGRLQILAGQLGAATAINVVLVVALYALAALSSWIIVTADGNPAVWPAALDIVKAMGATFLIFECWTLFGMTIAYLFRQSALAIGLGMAYMLAVEGILFRALSAFNIGWITTIEKFFVGQNANALATSFGQALPVRAASAPLVSAEQAVIVIILYALVFVAGAAALVRLRDVT